MNLKKMFSSINTNTEPNISQQLPQTEDNSVPDDDNDDIPVDKVSKFEKMTMFVYFIIYVLIGYKMYYFNMNLEYYFKDIKYNTNGNIFLTGGNMNIVAKETFDGFFGSEINDTLSENLKHAYTGWFDNYVYNLKLDFSYYFLILMNVINKIKLTRYFFTSLLFGGALFGGVMFLMFFITLFFSVYGLLRVFTMELPYYAFAIATPLFLMHFISGVTIAYYVFKMLLLKTNTPDNHAKKLIGGYLSFEKLILLFIIGTFITSMDKSNLTIYPMIVMLSLMGLSLGVYTVKYDFFLNKDWVYIKTILLNNKENMGYFFIFAVCIVLFYIYS